MKSAAETLRVYEVGWVDGILTLLDSGETSH
jgi:hypothetical protein